MRVRLLLRPLACALLGACNSSLFGARTPASDADRMRAAVQGVTDVMVYDIFSPPQAARVYAYSSIAAYEAMRPGFAGYRTLAGQVHELKPLPAPPAGQELSYPLAGVHAYLTVGKALTFSQKRVDSLRTAMDEEYRRTLSAPVFAASVAYGDTVARRILAWAGTDQYLQTRGAPKFAVTRTPGRWIPTPPAYLDAVEPHWGELRPFVLDSAGQFRPPPPPAFDTSRGSAFYAQAREVYDISKRLTDEQRAMAAFWDCNPYVMHVSGHAMFATKKISPGGHWMGIVAIATRQAHADVMRTAATYARTSIAIDDAFIAGWKEKFRSSLVRPETVINQYIDEGWEPVLQTPPFPEYISGHSIISMSAASVLGDEFGPRFGFVDSSETRFGLPPRSFPSFDSAATEAASSRLYGGIHYRMGVEEGVKLGRQVGALQVARLHLRDAATVAVSRP